MKRNILIIVPIAILFGVIGVYFGLKSHAPAQPADSAVTALLAQTLPDVDGKSQAFSQWAGRPMVVNFWATWCAPCVQEMPELSALQAELAPRKIQILGIGIDSPSNIAEFSHKYKISYPLYVAGMGGTELSRQFGNKTGSLPFTVLIGADGKIRKQYLGRLKFDELRRDLKELGAG
jgi:thiol-disulfide isomerase/thioredoxin